MSEDDTPFLLLDMLIAARTAVERTDNVTWDQFLRDAAVEDAVMRPIQVIGEAAYRMSAEFRESHPEIPWHEMIGMRHRLVHGYRQVAREIVWDTARSPMPALITALEAVVPSGEGD